MPIIIRISATLGLVMTASSRVRQSGSIASTVAPAVASVTVWPRDRHLAPVELRAADRRGRRATKSIDVLALSASSADRLTASRTARSAHSALRPRSLRQPADVGGRVVDLLASSSRPADAAGRAVALRARPCPCRRRRLGRRGGARHADRDRRRGAEVGRRRHRGDVARIEDVGAGARRARAARRDVTSPPGPARRGCP